MALSGRDRLFILEDKVSENDLCQSWQAIKRKGKYRCFLKIANKSSQLGFKTAKSIIANAYSLQRQIFSHKILRPVGIYRVEGDLLIEYPYLDSGRWSVLTERVLVENIDVLLPRMFEIVDFLHQLNLVHADLKISNFMVSDVGKDPQLILTDLDFILKSESSPEARVIGTINHIAPEILKNEKVTIKSDNFSIGKLLKSLVDAPYDNIKSDMRDRLDLLANSLIGEDPASRPAYLLDSLKHHDLIDPSLYEIELKSVMASQLISKYKSEKVKKSAQTGFLSNYLLNKCGVLGIPDEIITGLEELYLLNKLGALAILREIIRSSQIERAGEFFYLHISDEMIREVYAGLCNHLGKDYMIPDLKNGLKAVITECRRNIEKKRFIFAYLILQDVHEKISKKSNKSKTDEVKKLLDELARLSMILNRLDNAVRYYNELVEFSGSGGTPDLEALYQLSHIYIQKGELEEARQTAELGERLARNTGDENHLFMFGRNKSWVLSRKGKYDEAEKLLTDLAGRAELSGNVIELSKIKIILGNIEWFRNNFTESLSLFEEAVNLSDNSDNISDRISARSNVCITYFEFAEYDKCIQNSKFVINEAVKPIDQIRLRLSYSNLIESYVRLGEYKKAKFWLSRLFLYLVTQDVTGHISMYYYYQGFLLLNKGEYDKASDSLLTAREILPKSGPVLFNRLVYYLCEVALYRGDREQFKSYLAEAQTSLKKSNNIVSLAELDFFEALHVIYIESNPNKVKLLDLLERLLSLNCIFFSARTLFIILLVANRRDINRALDMAKIIVDRIDDSAIPLFQAISLMIKAHSYNKLSHVNAIAVLKKAYLIMNKAGSYFYAMLIAEKIGLLYLAGQKERLSRKFLGQTIKLAEKIGNQYYMKKIQKRLNTVAQKKLDDQGIKAFISNLSGIISNLDNYELALHHLIHFAVDETGAERGAILLSNEETGKLRIKVSVNCDDLSLKDITDFSSNIPRAVMENLEPIFIDDATKDEITKSYQSVIVHNILSVICVPLKIGEDAFGVLYLDHHTIPALFEQEDLNFIKAMAGLISIMLAALQDYNAYKVSNLELSEDLKTGGLTTWIEPKDNKMLEMLSGLPQIANSKASVLVQGASGTGKGLICQMLHDLSPRKDKPFLKINCAAMTQSLLESELFGIAANAASGVAGRDGKFSAADGGTLLFDEIGDMPLDFQSKILLVLDHQEFQKVGSNQSITTDVRFLFATNKNLSKMMKEGKFREDLYYRIQTIQLEIPPLRKRTDDILDLLDHFIKLFSQHIKPPRFSSEAKTAMLLYSWPGNVRELRNLVERYCILYPGRIIKLIDLPEDIKEAIKVGSKKKAAFEKLEKALIRESLIHNNWNKSKTARELGIPLATLQRKIKKYTLKKQ